MSDNNIGSPVRGLRMNSLKQSLAAGAAVTALLCGTAYAQQAAGSEQMETVYVTGYRASLESALSTKRQSNEMVDAINAEDIAAFPDANLAEALQRLPGVAVDRDEGEGRTITVRGLGQDFTRVTLNGLEALSTAGASDSSGSTPNRDRGFDFNTFAAELFSSLEVQKSSSAATEEGSLGATVGLNTGHPFDMGGKERFVLGGQNAYYEFGKPFNPRIIALASDTFLGGRLGALVSAAVMTRSQTIDSYQRSPGQSDYAYRGSAFAGVVLPDNSSIVGRNGFAAPTGTACTGANGVVPGATSLQAGVCAAESGSNAATYALINTPRGWTLTDSNTASPGTTSTVTAPGSLVLIPGLASLNHQVLYQRRLGLTVGAPALRRPQDCFSAGALLL